MHRPSLYSLLVLCQCSSIASAAVNIFAFGNGIQANSVLRFDPTSYTSSDAHLAQVTTAADIETNFDLYYWTINATGLFNRNYYAHVGSYSQGQLVFLPYGQAISPPGVVGVGLGWGVTSDGTVTVYTDTGFGPQQLQQFYACSNTTAPGDSTTYLTGQYLAIRNMNQSDPGCTPITLNINALGMNATQTSSVSTTTISTVGPSVTQSSNSVIYANTSSIQTTTTYPGPYTTVQPIEYTLTTATTATTVITAMSTDGVGIAPVGTDQPQSPGDSSIPITTTALVSPDQTTAMTLTTVVPGQSGPTTLTTVVPVQGGPSPTTTAAAPGQSNTVPVQSTSAGSQVGLSMVLPLASMLAIVVAML